MADINFIMAMSCAPPALLGLYKYKRVDKKFHPFLLALVLSLITELLIKLIFELETWQLYYITGNFYYLINVLLYQQFFIRVLEKKQNRINWYLMAGFIFSSIVNSFFNKPLKSLLLYAAFLFAVFILGNAVRLLSNQVFETRVKLLRNPLFYISAGCILFNSYFLLTQAIFFTIGNIEWLTDNNFFIEKTINAFTYLVFTIALVWIPKKN